jgi:tRNA wybutosine-synthesizing protein 5|tara:strand:- start:2376 stop:4010 length:1635 start_codon:yes stop_codon:yes gene_type:complete
MDPGIWGYQPVGQVETDVALVVSSHDAKRWKDLLDASGCLDRSRRPVTHPGDANTGLPSCVAFPVRELSLNKVRTMASGDVTALAVCAASLPQMETPVDQKAAARASSDEAGKFRAFEFSERLPPALPNDNSAPPLWPPPVPKTQRREVRRVRCPSTCEEFDALVKQNNNQPVVLTGMWMGDALVKWTPERFATCPEANSLVDVHVCPPPEIQEQTLDPKHNKTNTVDLAGHRAPGTKRNFEFRKMGLAEFVARVTGNNANALPPVIAQGETYYLRSVSGVKKAEAHFFDLFPGLFADLTAGPRGCALFGAGSIYDTEKYHSSVLRVASRGVALWTHYDTHDNLLAQVVGRKRVTLWSPDAEPFMHCEGSSSRVDDMDEAVDLDEALVARKKARDAAFPNFKNVSTARVVAHLNPGEALFIPALWFHHAHALDDDDETNDEIDEDDEDDEDEKNCMGKHSRDDGWGGASVAVNVFWRSLGKDEHDRADVFGNKDPPAARQAVEYAQKAGAFLSALPEPQRRFYARRAIAKLAEQIGMRLELPDS